MLTKKEIDVIAKDVCWEDGGGANCKLDCVRCRAGHWKHWKKAVLAVEKSLIKLNKLK